MEDGFKKYTGPYQDLSRLYSYYDIDGQKVGIANAGSEAGQEVTYYVLIDQTEYSVIAEPIYDRSAPPSRRHVIEIFTATFEDAEGMPASAETLEIFRKAFELDTQKNNPGSVIKLK